MAVVCRDTCPRHSVSEVCVPARDDYEHNRGVLSFGQPHDESAPVLTNELQSVSTPLSWVQCRSRCFARCSNFKMFVGPTQGIAQSRGFLNLAICHPLAVSILDVTLVNCMVFRQPARRGSNCGSTCFARYSKSASLRV
jgi:hypothetical protein